MVSMCDHIVIYVQPSPPLMRQNAISEREWLRLTTPRLMRQNALSVSQWMKLLAPYPEEAYLPQKWDIEKGIY